MFFDFFHPRSPSSPRTKKYPGLRRTMCLNRDDKRTHSDSEWCAPFFGRVPRHNTPSNSPPPGRGKVWENASDVRALRRGIPLISEAGIPIKDRPGSVARHRRRFADWRTTRPDTKNETGYPRPFTWSPPGIQYSPTFRRSPAPDSSAACSRIPDLSTTNPENSLFANNYVVQKEKKFHNNSVLIDKFKEKIVIYYAHFDWECKFLILCKAENRSNCVFFLFLYQRHNVPVKKVQIFFVHTQFYKWIFFLPELNLKNLSINTKGKILDLKIG